MIFILSTPLTSAFAKTEGNYFGVDFVNTRTDLDQIKQSDGSKIKYNNGDEDNSNQPSAGINYKYALNYRSFFAMPELFAEYSNATARTISNDELSLKYRYGARLNLGYDYDDFLAVYLITGFANNNYEVLEASNGSKKTGNDFAPIYGGGFKLSMTKQIDLNFSYEVSDVTMKTQYQDKWNFDVKVLRIGLAYKF